LLTLYVHTSSSVNCGPSALVALRRPPLGDLLARLPAKQGAPHPDEP
jgi:hypothetical protein